MSSWWQTRQVVAASPFYFGEITPSAWDVKRIKKNGRPQTRLTNRPEGFRDQARRAREDFRRADLRAGFESDPASAKRMNLSGCNRLATMRHMNVWRFLILQAAKEESVTAEERLLGSLQRGEGLFLRDRWRIFEELGKRSSGSETVDQSPLSTFLNESAVRPRSPSAIRAVFSDRRARAPSVFSEKRAKFASNCAWDCSKHCMVRSICSGDIGWNSTEIPRFRSGTAVMPSSS